MQRTHYIKFRLLQLLIIKVTPYWMEQINAGDTQCTSQLSTFTHEKWRWELNYCRQHMIRENSI